VALRTKTVEYPFVTNTTQTATATRLDFAAITVYIPETSSRTFRSVILEIGTRGGETVAASITAWLMGIKLGAVAFSDVTTTLTLTNTGDQQGHVFTRDVTAYFVTNFGAGASQTCQAGLTVTGIGSGPTYAKLIITYEYDDDSATTRVKTVRIPIESPTAQLTATLASIGTNQVPNLDTFLPEASKTYRSVWFESYYNDGGNATTDFQLALALDAEAESSRGNLEQALNSSVFGKDIWIRDDMTTNATHDLKARSNATASRFSLLAVVLHVTYEYDHSASTSIMNSLVLPFADESAFPGSTTSADKGRFARAVWIEEPTTITQAQSGCLCFANFTGSVTLTLQAGAQSSRAYSLTAGSVQAGPYAVCHRIDSGSAAGAWGSLARGKNTINFDRWVGAASGASNFSSILYLNYTSGKATDGDGVHNHSTCWSICDMANALTTQRNLASPGRLFNLPESLWYVNGLCYEVLGTMTGASASGAVMQAEIQSAEERGAGWWDLLNCLYLSDGELSVFWTASAGAMAFNRYPGDPTPAMDVETTRQYRICSVTNMSLGVRAWLTYHAITATVSGTISGSAGGTVNLYLHCGVEDCKLLSSSRSGDGAYSFTWLDDTQSVYVSAYEDATHKGLSKKATATSGFDVSLAAGGGECYF